MKEIIKDYGKIGITVENELYNSEKDYEKLTIVETESGSLYLSKKDVPASLHIDITDKNYWFNISNSGTPISEDNINPLILDEKVEAFLNNTYYDGDTFYASNISKFNKDNEILDKPKKIKIKVPNNLVGAVFYGETSENLTNKIDFDYGTDYVELTNLIPNKYYFYNISEKIGQTYNTIVSDLFKTSGSRRFIDLPDAYNVRDLGGIKTINGHKIKYNNIYRGSEYTEEDYYFLFSKFSSVNIVDLRNSSEREGKYIAPTSHNYPNFPNYSNVPYLSDEQKLKIISAVNKVIDICLVGGKVYINCVYGAHRTGLLSSIILNILGVSQSEIDKDYELTSFDKDFKINNLRRNNNDYGYKAGNEYIKEYYDGKWENFLIENYLDKDKLERFKKYMIEDYKSSINNVSGEIYYYVTYAEILQLIAKENLNPGYKYRITDYRTKVDIDEEIAYNGTTGYVNITSDETPFDIIVTAISNKELDCVANILEHNPYNILFPDYDLSKFKVWYDVNNDKSKYGWAHNEGYGVIYRMIDDKRNDIPYDFLNIKFDDKYTLHVGNGYFESIETILNRATRYDAPSLRLEGYDNFIYEEAMIIKNVSAWININVNTNIDRKYFTLYVLINEDSSNIYFDDKNLYIVSNYIGKKSNVFLRDGMDDYYIYRVQSDYINFNNMITVTSNVRILIYIRLDDSIILGNKINPNIINTNIKPYIKNNIRHLNCNIISTDKNDTIKNIRFDSDCKFNNIVNSTDIKFDSYCFGNKINESNLIELKESSVMNEINNSNRVILDSYNMYGKINNCKNIDVEPYMYNLQLDNQGSTEEHIDVKQQESSVIIIED